jgi:hypothetical protein
VHVFFGTKTHDSFLVTDRTKQASLFVIGARREEELVGLTVPRSSSTEGNPPKPLSLIIFLRRGERPDKAPGRRVKSVDAAIVQVPHQHTIADEAELRGRKR